MKSQTLMDIIECCYFGGGWSELRQLMRKEKSGGKWRDLGQVKCWTSKGYSPFCDYTKVYFWPATGRILECVCHVSLPKRKPRLNWAKKRAALRVGERWTVFRLAGIGAFSLPELVMKRPDYFFGELLHGLDPLPTQIDKFELAELLDKLSAIRIPARYGEGAWMLNQYGGEFGDYLGFEITAKPLKRATGKWISISKCIDVECWRDYRGCKGFNSPIPSLMLALEGDASVVWSRSKCESFFDDKKNFVRTFAPFKKGGSHRKL